MLSPSLLDIGDRRSDRPSVVDAVDDGACVVIVIIMADSHFVRAVFEQRLQIADCQLASHGRFKGILTHLLPISHILFPAYDLPCIEQPQMVRPKGHCGNAAGFQPGQ